MTIAQRMAQGPAAPLRHLRLLARWAPVAAVAFALLAVGSAWAAVPVVKGLLAGDVGTGPGSTPLLPVLLALVVDVAFAVVAGRVAYRLGVEVPRVLHGWSDALAERVEAQTRP